jgi:hypothetical protein
MSPTLTSLATNAMSTAFERIESIYENLVEEMHAKLLAWGAVDVDIDNLQSYRPENLVEDVRRAAVTKWTMSRLIRTRPEMLPPQNMSYDGLFVDRLIKLGDAETLDDLANAVADLKYTLEGSSWNFNAVQAAVPVEEPEDALGFSNDLGEVSAGPAEEPRDEDAARQ